MNDKIYDTKFTRELITIHSLIVAKHIKIAIDTGQDWNDIGNKSEKYIKNIFNKHINLIETLKDLTIIQQIIEQRKFPELQSVPTDIDFVYFNRFYYQLFKVKIISIIDISARLILAVNDLNYNFYKINLKQFNKEPLLANTNTLFAFKGFWNDFKSIRKNDRNVIIHEGGYKSGLIETIDEYTLKSDSIIYDSEYFRNLFDSRKEENLVLLNKETLEDIEKVLARIDQLTESLIQTMKKRYNDYRLYSDAPMVLYTIGEGISRDKGISGF